MYVFGYKIAEIIDIFVKMNTNTTQSALQGFCEASGMEAERLQARANATTAGAAVSGSLSDKLLQALIHCKNKTIDDNTYKK